MHTQVRALTPHCYFTVLLDHATPLGAHLSHGHLVHVFGVLGPRGQEAISLQGQQGFDGDGGTVVCFQILWSGSVGLQQDNDVFSGLVTTSTCSKHCASKKVLRLHKDVHVQTQWTNLLNVNLQSRVFTTRWRTI